MREREGERDRVRRRERVCPDLPSRWFQHCEVEKRRRERMNCYMNELAQMIPACSAVPRRLDKLSIVKMAVDHMKSLRGACACVCAYLCTCVCNRARAYMCLCLCVCVSICMCCTLSVCPSYM